MINHLLEDDDGHFWIGRNRGIFRVNRRELIAVAEGSAVPMHCVIFDATDGLVSSETNAGRQPGACKTRDGQLWFPTGRGVVVIDPSTVPINTNPPPVHVEQVKADDKFIHVSGTDALLAHPGNEGRRRPAANGILPVRLPPGSARVLEFRYTATSLIAPDKCRFKFKLEGHDPDWREDNDNRRVAFYTNLKPGPYTFRVIAGNNHGYWNTAGAAFAFSLAPHFWQTWTFYALCVLVTLGVGLSAHAWRLRGVRHLESLRQQLAIEQERLRIADDIHDDVGSRLTQISVLGELAQRQTARPADAKGHLQALTRSASEAFRGLDEIVWTLNHRHDSLAGLSSYVREFALELLEPAGIRCRFDFPNPVPALALASDVRHHLFLAIKEALNNAVKHSRATKVWLRLRVNDRTISIHVEDNGCGLPASAPHAPAAGGNGNGLTGMRHRLAQIGGRCIVVARPEGGVTVRMEFPTPSKPG
jgi:signal transduction histidine kinase